ncbi:MAG: divalent-cation tolerance protein CutA [Dehalococcoidia bacterium]|nr:divalent-cation tolerance protein CutA [Dehalococcoidia bacterium]
MQYRSIYITAKDESEAREIGVKLVAEKLAACVNFFPVHSIYRWRGKIEEAGEIALIVKTRAGLVDRVIKRVKELHSYKVPCIVSWAIDKGNTDYLGWIKESTE